MYMKLERFSRPPFTSPVTCESDDVIKTGAEYKSFRSKIPATLPVNWCG